MRCPSHVAFPSSALNPLFSPLGCKPALWDLAVPSPFGLFGGLSPARVGVVCLASSDSVWVFGVSRVHIPQPNLNLTPLIYPSRIVAIAALCRYLLKRVVSFIKSFLIKLV